MSRLPVAPDILWIVATQWRAQACGYAGDVNAHTPALDALAADPATVSYTEAVTPHPFGPFARAALLTGQPSPENGVRDYWDALPCGADTIAHRLGRRGYATAFFGKWGVGERDRAAPLVGEAAAKIVVPPEARGGFGHWVGFEGGFQLNDPWLHGDGRGDGLTPRRARGYQSDVLTNEALIWLARPATAPRFTVVSLEAPHPPYAAPTPAGIVRLRPEEVILTANVPRGGEIEARARRELAGYYAHIAATDAAIGRLLAQVAAETAVVFTSVHGDMHGAHGLFRKGWPHEESIRVPLLVRGGVRAAESPVAPGRHSGEAVSLLDLPSMAEAWSEGRAWTCPRERAEISMPSAVALPDQCDRTWSGWRSATEKRVFGPEGTEWVLDE
jgi:arylsulfatase A-like enzyme